MSTERFKNVTSFVINLLNNKTIILLNLAEYRLILADSGFSLIASRALNVTMSTAPQEAVINQEENANLIVSFWSRFDPPSDFPFLNKVLIN